MGCGGISSTNFYEASTSLIQQEDVSSRRENCRLILHKKMQKSYHIRKLGMMMCNRYVLTKLSRNARLISQCKINERNISHKHVKKEKLHVFICSFNKYLLSTIDSTTVLGVLKYINEQILSSQEMQNI